MRHPLVYILLAALLGLAFLKAGPQELPATGKATFYGKKFHGKKTASGEVYDMKGYTAAHRNLPFGTLVKVTGLKNGKAVIVRVNDRGPASKKYVIDVSRAAAEHLGMLKGGVIKVRIEYAGEGEEPGPVTGADK